MDFAGDGASCEVVYCCFAVATALVERLNAARAVLWVVRSREVKDRLVDLGVGNLRRTGQFIVPARLVGLKGDDLEIVGPT